MERRTFLKSTCAAGIGVTGMAAILESCSKLAFSLLPQGPTVNFTLDLTQPVNTALNIPGGSIASHGVIVVNEGGSYIAVAQTCTHQGCSIAYQKSQNDFVCPCHGGTYDINGNVIAGPRPRR